MWEQQVILPQEKRMLNAFQEIFVCLFVPRFIFCFIFFPTFILFCYLDILSVTGNERYRQRKQNAQIVHSRLQQILHTTRHIFLPASNSRQRSYMMFITIQRNGCFIKIILFFCIQSLHFIARHNPVPYRIFINNKSNQI